jgi:glycosyltransferase involved in cell wall biosynthesis
MLKRFMRILYDHQVFSFQRFGGISRYFYELMVYAGAGASMPFIYTDNHYLMNSMYRKNNIAIDTVFANRHLGAANRVFSKAGYNFPYSHNRRKSLDAISGGDFDLFHPTYYDPYFLGHIGDKPFVITVHDMIHEIYPEHFPPGEPVSEWKRKVIPKAAMVIAISESTKRDLLKFIDVDKAKVQVIYHGNSLEPDKPNSAPDMCLANGLPQKYLLFVGDRKAYKNFYFLIESLAPLIKKESFHIVCSGGGAFGLQERLFFKRLDVDDRVRQYSVDDDTLVELYRRALAFIYPSLYEGFGIPVIEAFACGCPALLSNTSSLLEIGGDAADYFTPKDTDSMRNAVEKIIHDDDLREKLKAKGMERSRLFTWEKTTQETFTLYNDILSGTRATP